MSADEIWKDIAGHEGRYQVSNMGRVKSLVKPYRRMEKVLKGSPNTTGYILVQLQNGKEGRHSLLVHRLVMMAFEPREGMDEMQVNHKDFDISNNKLSNLEWTTRQENMDHYTSSDKFTNRTINSTHKGENHHLCVMTDELVIELRRRYGEIKKVGGSRSKLAREFGIAESTARLITNGVTWKHLL